MGLSSARVDEAEIAAHHMEHFLELSSGKELEFANDIIDQLRAGEFLQAELGLEQLLDVETPSESEEGQGEVHDDTEEHDEAEGPDVTGPGQ